MMAIPHASSAQIVDVRPLNEKITDTKTHTLFKTDAMEAIRLVLPAGKQIAEHKAPGEITVQCLEGRIEFTANGQVQALNAGEMLYLDAAQPHAVKAIDDSTVLVTILLR